MPSDLSVARLSAVRLGQVNLFTDDYAAALAQLRATLGAEVLREEEVPERGGRSALAQVGTSQLGVFGAAAPGLAIGSWLAANGAGWHSLGWIVPSLDGAVQTLGERGIQVAGSAGGTGVFTRPEDLYGLCLHLTTEAPAGPGGAGVAGDAAYWPDKRQLGITGGPTVKVASPDPGQAADDVAGLVGRPAYEVERPHLNAVGYGVRFGDHAVEFVDSASGGDHDLVGGFLDEHGQCMFAIAFRVRDFAATRAALAAGDVPFTQWGRHSLLLRPELTHGARIELTDES
jgi:catechol 2,3-dioxygenase-like lactoylglutathione lyase family enzyme